MVAVTASQCWWFICIQNYSCTLERARAPACTYVNKKRSSAAAAAAVLRTAARIININGSVDSEISVRFVDQARCRIDLERAKRSVRARSLMSAYWKFTCFDSIIHAYLHTYMHNLSNLSHCTQPHRYSQQQRTHTRKKNSLL